MTQTQKISLFILRVSLGFLYLYAGYSKIVNPAWSAEGYLKNAKGFPSLFSSLADPGVLPLVNTINEWGLFLLGVSLIIGLGVRFSSVFGILLMGLYYLPLGFPYPNEHAYIVDEHIIYIAALFVLFTMRAGRTWGLGRWSSSVSALRGWFD